MAIHYDDHDYTGLSKFVETGKSLALVATGVPQYAHPLDSTILKGLESLPGKSLMEGAVNNFAAFISTNALTSGVPISARTFPDIWRILNHCSRTLGIPTPPTIMSQDAELIGAFAFGTGDQAFICVSATLLQLFTHEQSAFILGHECGHIACNHMFYKHMYYGLTSAAGLFGTVGRLISQTSGFSLSAWMRRAQITADRAGLICCGDIRDAEQALIRKVLGLADPSQVDLEDYLNQSMKLEEEYVATQFGQLLSGSTSTPKRIRALRVFADSELYYDITHKPRPADRKLVTKEELDRMVGSIVL